MDVVDCRHNSTAYVVFAVPVRWLSVARMECLSNDTCIGNHTSGVSALGCLCPIHCAPLVPRHVVPGSGFRAFWSMRVVSLVADTYMYRMGSAYTGYAKFGCLEIEFVLRKDAGNRRITSLAAHQQLVVARDRACYGMWVLWLAV